MKHDLRFIGTMFGLYGDFIEAAPFGSGHINDTYAATYNQGGSKIRYIHQRINHTVFPDPPALMENISRVTCHIRKKLQELGSDDVSRRVLTVIPAVDGSDYYRDAEGSCWRTYIFIEKADTYDVIESATQAYEAAKAFGRFQGLLFDMPGGRLNETIADFHNTPKRFEALEKAIAEDVCGRAESAKAEIDFCLARKEITTLLLDHMNAGRIPERVTHNDTKLNNVMLDDASMEGICVIDLDTVMPGLAHYDFGDMVRTATSNSAEDEKDLSKVEMRMEIFEAIAKGYLETAGEALNPLEKELLPFSGKLITFEIGIRFLTDYLSGDTYFKTSRDGHNLDRCRTQFKLVESIESQFDEMNKLVANLV